MSFVLRTATKFSLTQGIRMSIRPSLNPAVTLSKSTRTVVSPVISRFYSSPPVDSSADSQGATSK